MRNIRIAAVAVLAMTCAFAADLNGKWKAQVPTRAGGSREVTFTFKVDGDKVTGTMADDRGSDTIADGKLSGDTITFTNETPRGKRTYTGVVSGDEIKFKRDGGAQAAQEFVAKRAS